MFLLFATSAFFLAIHFGISGTRARDAIIGRIGLTTYLGLFSLASIAGLVGMCFAYASSPSVDLWGQLHGLRGVAAVVNLLAFVFVVLGLATPNATGVGAESLLEAPGAAVRGITRVTRHPFLWGVAIWAMMHTVVNGNLASLIFFGSFALLASLGPVILDRRKARLLGPAWADFAGATSALPFAAIVQGRNRFRPAELGWWKLALAVGLYGLALYFHAPVFGVPALSF